ncbi:MAG TPA: PIN domain-containing protein [Candidatus Acidoferrum sp.]|nr:PIN domain-containing protein [Candidatus Acidoferrum sp.]
MSRIFWDTNVFIYLLEDYGELSEKAAELRKRMKARGDQLFTSCLTLGEVLVKPLEHGDADLGRRYEKAISSTSNLIPFDVNAAKRYASLRQDRTIKPPDAIQLACAASVQMDLFVTNDRRLQGKNVDGIQFIVSLDSVPL